jgi:transcription-repair coupling factor (superfamily II helicase)
MPSIYFSWEEIEARVNQIPSLYLYSWEPENGNGLLNPQYGPVEKFGGSYNRFRSEIAKLAGEKKSLAVVSFQAERIAEILKEVGIPCSLEPERSKPVSPGEVAVFKGIVDGGWSLDGKYYLYSDSEIQGFARQNRQVARKPGRHTISLDRIKPGDFVVHIDHGIARFGGITSMETSGSPREFLVLEYSHQDRLYVPVDQVDRVSRYIGSGDAVPPLNRLGTEQWQNTRKKALEAAQEIASELLELYSRREIVNGFSFSGDSVWQKELEASFPYVETADQISALEQIKKDMLRPRPMDRLLLGDVGYGKTEVALRAAFKAVQDNMQVAVLVPTTLLLNSIT